MIGVPIKINMPSPGSVVLDRLPVHAIALRSLMSVLKTLNVKIFKCLDCRGTKRLPDFPSSVRVIECRFCEHLLELPELPPALEVLKLHGCENMKDDFHEIPLPASLQQLQLVSAPNITRLQATLPSGLCLLNVSGCAFLTELPNLPSTLRYLNCSFCWRLRPPSLPSSVVTYVGDQVGYLLQ